MRRELSYYVPDPSTREFIGRIYRSAGPEAAAEIVRALYEGVLIDCGEVSSAAGDSGSSPSPARPGAAGPRQQVLELWPETGGGGTRHGGLEVQRRGVLSMTEQE